MEKTIGINRILLEALHALRNLNDILMNQLKPASTAGSAEDEWLLPGEVMTLLRTGCRKTLYNWTKANAVAHRKFGRYTLYLKSDVYRLTAAFPAIKKNK
jgi:hypothetical protein